MKAKLREADTRATAKTIEIIKRSKGLEGVAAEFSTVGALFGDLNV
jgi:hypothetical protein